MISNQLLVVEDEAAIAELLLLLVASCKILNTTSIAALAEVVRKVRCDVGRHIGLVHLKCGTIGADINLARIADSYILDAEGHTAG